MSICKCDYLLFTAIVRITGRLICRRCGWRIVLRTKGRRKSIVIGLRVKLGLNQILFYGLLNLGSDGSIIVVIIIVILVCLEVSDEIAEVEVV